MMQGTQDRMDGPSSAPEDERFYSSGKSRLGRTRTGLRYALAGGFLVAVLASGGSAGVLAVTGGILLLLLVPLDLYLRSLMRPGQPVVTLDAEAIGSANLTGKVKRYAWQDIEGVAVESTQGTPFLRFRLKAVPDRRSLWSGANPARPTLVLSPFTEEDQERLVDAVNRRLGQAPGGATAQADGANALRENREFQARLKALAPHAWATYALVAANIAVWLAMAGQAGNFLQTPADQLLLWGGNAASEVQRGEWWRLLTATFLHGGLMHVAMNMIGLLGAGIMVERIYGIRLFLLIYFGSGLLGSALSLHFSAQEAVSVGASGAVFGVTGALLVAVWQHRDKLPKAFGKEMLSGIGFFILYALMQGFGKTGIDNAAHVGGLVGGCLLAFILPERFDMAHYRRHYLGRALLALATAGAATVGLAAMAPRAAIDQARIIASAPLLEDGFKRFDAAIKAIQQEQSDVQAGKRSEREADERARAVHAPEFRAVAAELAQVTLRPDDPRGLLLRDARRMSELLAESLGMDSVLVDGGLQPADPARMARLNAELGEVAARMKTHMEALDGKK